MDGTQIKAPFGGAATGGNRVDRTKQGTKRSQLSEGHGLPLAVVLVAANRNDMIVAAATLDAIAIAVSSFGGTRSHVPIWPYSV